MLARFDEASRVRCLAAAVVMLETPVLGIPAMSAPGWLWRRSEGVVFGGSNDGVEGSGAGGSSDEGSSCCSEGVVSVGRRQRCWRLGFCMFRR
jgi:hypothetical protein